MAEFPVPIRQAVGSDGTSATAFGYANVIMLVLTQLNKLGTVVRICCCHFSLLS